MSLVYTKDKIPEEQANVVPNKTIASRLREVHGTTGETVATAIPGAGPVMYVDAYSTFADGVNGAYDVLTKTLNEIKQAIDNNIFVVVIKRNGNKSAYIEYIGSIYNNPERGLFYVHTIAIDPNGNLVINNYTTDNSNGYPKLMRR